MMRCRQSELIESFVAERVNGVGVGGFYGLKAHCHPGDQEGKNSSGNEIPELAVDADTIGETFKPSPGYKIGCRPGDDVGRQHQPCELLGQ